MSVEIPQLHKSACKVFSQGIVNDDDAWGLLCYIRRSCRPLVMTKSQYTIGRNTNCNIVFKIKGKEKQETPENLVQVRICEPLDKIITFSKIHFKIFRDLDVVYLEDNSFNGTFVNGTVVGKGKKVILQNDDEISLSHPKDKYFVYIDKQLSVVNDKWSSYPYLKDNYFISKTLGSGSFGEVKLVFHKKTFVKYAMKMVQVKNVTNEWKESEVEILKILDNPFVIKYDNVINTTNKILVCFEYMEGGNLFRRIKSYGKLDEICSQWIFYQLVRGVEYLHDQGITHKNLKPENILLSSEDDFPFVKISDFGLSKLISSGSFMKTLCRTPVYVAPEVLETKGRGIYSNKVDVWSMGVILYVCLSGSIPFKLNREDMNLDEQIMRGEYTFSSFIWKTVSPEATSLISCLMTLNPKMRIMVNMVKAHPWLKLKPFQEKLKQLEEIELPDFS